MSLSNLPAIISTFLDASNAGNIDALGPLFTSDAVVIDANKIFFGEAVSAWCNRQYSNTKVFMHPINISRVGDQTVVTVMASAREASSDFPHPVQLDLQFKFQSTKIASLTLKRSQPPTVADVIAEFIQAMNTHDLEKLMATFSEAAMVNDQLQEFWGKDSIRRWAAESVTGERMTMYVESVIQHHGTTIVRANVDGDFDKRGMREPLEVSFYFSVDGNLIVQLVILNIQND